MKTILNIYNCAERAKREKRKSFIQLKQFGWFTNLVEMSHSIIADDSHTFSYRSIASISRDSLRGLTYDVIVIDDYVDLMNYDTSNLFAAGVKVMIQGDGYRKEYTTISMEDTKSQHVTIETSTHKYKYRSAEIARSALPESHGHSRDTRMMMNADVVYDKTTKRFIKDRYIGQEKANEYLDFIGE